MQRQKKTRNELFDSARVAAEVQISRKTVPQHVFFTFTSVFKLIVAL